MTRYGIQLPHYGGGLAIGLRELAESIVEAGFDGIWVSDHVVLVDGSTSRYPYSADGSYAFPAGTPWLEAVTTLAYLAACTRDVELGTSICVLPQRQPVLLAKQIASVDWLAGGRVRLGVGIGWLAEEFAALGMPYTHRGARADDALALLRACWSGSPAAGRYGDVDLPPGVRCEPRPTRGTVPIHVGGNSPAALRRAARAGDGWLGAVPVSGLPPAELRRLRDTLAAECERAGRDPSTVEITLRLVPVPDLDRLLAEYTDLGVDRFTFDLGGRDLDGYRRRLDAVARTVHAVRA